MRVQKIGKWTYRKPLFNLPIRNPQKLVEGFPFPADPFRSLNDPRVNFNLEVLIRGRTGPFVTVGHNPCKQEEACCRCNAIHFLRELKLKCNMLLSRDTINIDIWHATLNTCQNIQFMNGILFNSFHSSYQFHTDTFLKPKLCIKDILYILTIN